MKRAPINSNPDAHVGWWAMSSKETLTQEDFDEVLKDCLLGDAETSASKAPAGIKKTDGTTYFELSGDKKKRLSIWSSKGKVLVDIREYYLGNSKKELLPGKKGVSLNPAQFQYIIDHADEISATIKTMESTIKTAESNSAYQNTWFPRKTKLAK
ncbi:Transcriptional coactivator [Podila humilis]|nr:Transcriptional coactivator [Podila humilis]